jgi:hypothetical protein
MGTSLTVYCSSVVTGPEEAVAAGAVVVVVVAVVVVVGVEVCARSPVVRLPRRQAAAEQVLISLVVVSFMWR